MLWLDELAFVYSKATRIDMFQGLEDGELATLNMVLVGDSGVGKTSIARRIVNGQFKQSHQPTIVPISYLKIIPQQNIRLEIHDTSGNIAFRHFTPQLLRKANCIIFVFDLSRPDTFSQIEYLRNFDFDNKKMFVVCGCKSDKVLNKQIVQNSSIDNQLLKELKQEGLYYEVSAINGSSIEDMFAQLYEKWERDHQSQYKQSLQWKIRDLYSQRQQINKRLKQNKEQIRKALRKKCQILKWLCKRKNAKDIKDERLRLQMVMKQKQLMQFDAMLPDNDKLLGTLDTLTYNAQALVRQYEADTLKLRERLAQRDSKSETITKLQERCRILQSICDQFEMSAFKNLVQLMNKVTAAYQRYKKQYMSQFKASIIEHRENSLSIASNILEELNLSLILQ